MRVELKQKEIVLQQVQDRIDEMTKIRDEQLYEAAEKHGSAEHTIVELQKKMDKEMQELVAVSTSHHTHHTYIHILALGQQYRCSLT